MSKAKEIRAKISSIKSTQKITKAMEMVAVSKMRNAQAAMEKSRPYAKHIRNLVGHIASASSTYRHAYMKTGETKRVGFIIVSTDRGLCGGLNVHLLKKAVEAVKEWAGKNVNCDFCLFGNKAISFFKQFGGNVISAIPHLNESITVADLIGSIKTMLDLYHEGKISKLYIAYNQFVNTMTQKPVVEQLVPLEPITVNENAKFWDYIYEPSHEKILDGLIVRYIESQIYNAVMDSFACEHAARMVAMKNATENAANLTEELQLIYNKARQAAITQEISEIVGGSSAV